MSSRQIAQQRLTNLKIVDDKKLIEPMKDIDLLDKSVISNITLKGGPNISERSGQSLNDDNGAGEKKLPKETFVPIEKQPEFPGGMKAWLNFLSRILKVPDDLEAWRKNDSNDSFYSGF